jgi:hypothetical protein
MTATELIERWRTGGKVWKGDTVPSPLPESYVAAFKLADALALVMREVTCEYPGSTVEPDGSLHCYHCWLRSEIERIAKGETNGD